jgi:hypothetical protein
MASRPRLGRDADRRSLPNTAGFSQENIYELNRRSDHRRLDRDRPRYGASRRSGRRPDCRVRPTRRGGATLTQELRNIGVEAGSIRADVCPKTKPQPGRQDRGPLWPARCGRQQRRHRRQARSSDGADTRELRVHLRIPTCSACIARAMSCDTVVQSAASVPQKVNNDAAASAGPVPRL